MIRPHSPVRLEWLCPSCCRVQPPAAQQTIYHFVGCKLDEEAQIAIYGNRSQTPVAERERCRLCGSRDCGCLLGRAPENLPYHDPDNRPQSPGSEG